MTSFLDLILGRPLPSSEERAEAIGPAKGIPIFGLDALGSAAYGPEAALTLLIPAGLVGLHHLMPISLIIITLLLIVFFSYRQTIQAYPTGGGSYNVVRANLGQHAGLLAGSALLLDYSLGAAVGISAGVGALTSAIPSWHPHTLGLTLAALAFLTVLNLRGLRETGAVFVTPTYLFLTSMAVMLFIGLFKAFSTGGHPQALVAPPVHAATGGTVSLWLLLRSYASGCAALTGVEAVSDGTGAFKEDRVQNARLTLGLIIGCLVVLLAGIAYLTEAYGIIATDPNGKEYQSLLSMLVAAITGRNWFYYLAIGSTVILLILSANTAFADFPRVCHFIAENGYLPTSFANRGRRLVYSEGICVLAGITAVLLVGFGGITDRLIPLFAVGAFLSFTMSQAGMVAHWWRKRKPNWRSSFAVNLTGSIATGASVIVILTAKFAEGAYITLIVIPIMLAIMYGVHAHYAKIHKAIQVETPLDLTPSQPPILIVTMQNWTRVNRQALRRAMDLSSDVHVVHVAEEDTADDFCGHWEEFVIEPARRAGVTEPTLVRLESPYRLVVTPLVEFVQSTAARFPDRHIITVIPELMEEKPFYWLLHTQRAAVLKARLSMLNNDRVSVLNVMWHLR